MKSSKLGQNASFSKHSRANRTIPKTLNFHAKEKSQGRKSELIPDFEPGKYRPNSFRFKIREVRKFSDVDFRRFHSTTGCNVLGYRQRVETKNTSSLPMNESFDNIRYFEMKNKNKVHIIEKVKRSISNHAIRSMNLSRYVSFNSSLVGK